MVHGTIMPGPYLQTDVRAHDVVRRLPAFGYLQCSVHEYHLAQYKFIGTSSKK